MTPRAARYAVPGAILLALALAAVWAVRLSRQLPDVEPSAPPAASAPPPAAPAAAPTPPPRRRVVMDAPSFGPLERKALHGPKGDFPFSERRYDPPLLLPEIARLASPEDLTSPEVVLAFLYAAMKRGDFDGAVALFDDSSRVELLAEPELRPVYLEAWRQEMAGHDFALTRRVDFSGSPGGGRAVPREALGAAGTPAVAWAAVYKRDGDGPELPSPHALVQLADGTWRLTNALVDHPVYAYDERQTDVTVQTIR